MMQFLSSLEQLSFSKWVLGSGSIWGYATIIFLHSLGMALIAGINGAIDLRLLGFAPFDPGQASGNWLYPWMWSGLATSNAITGTILLVGRMRLPSSPIRISTSRWCSVFFRNRDPENHA